MVLTPEVLSKYAYVLIDCPPNLGLITKNGLLISDGYVVPVVPQRMSVIGLSMIETQVKEYAQNKEKVIPLLGVVFTKVRRLSSYDSIKKNVCNRFGADVFKAEFNENDAIGKAAEWQETGVAFGRRGRFCAGFCSGGWGIFGILSSDYQKEA